MLQRPAFGADLPLALAQHIARGCGLRIASSGGEEINGCEGGAHSFAEVFL
ncbi:hypothetical protein D3C86_1826410 [compost metagenome]